MPARKSIWSPISASGRWVATVLTAAWQASKADVDIDARVAILEGLVALKAESAKTALTEALAAKPMRG